VCGIVGYVGDKDVIDILIDGLCSLEYRGYDSAGVAVLDGGAVSVVRSVGDLRNLQKALNGQRPEGTVGIGHTRWATHGRPSEANAHPHRDCSGRIAVVHNGILENFHELRDELIAAGHGFASETDTEVLAHLIEDAYEGDLLQAVVRALGRVHGSYAIAVLHQDEPRRVVAARQDSPLVVGLGEGENFVASDIPAILSRTREVIIVEDGEIADVGPDGVSIHKLDGAPVERAPVHIDWDAAAAEKGGYEDFMLKEIHEQPHAFRETVRGRIDSEHTIQLDELALTREQVHDLTKLYVVACGTSYHAGMFAKYLIEKLARVSVEIDVASEFRYRDPVVDERTLVVAISQSGETADTLAGIREAKCRGAKVMAVTNVVGSSVSREADAVIYTHAGPEIGVAATKTFVSQIGALYVVAAYLAQERGHLDRTMVADIASDLEAIPAGMERILDDSEVIEEAARYYVDAPNALFLGRGVGVPIAFEGALKLKEISYLHAEGYAAGEMKHGPIALLEKGMPVVVVATCGSVYEKVLSNIQEVLARDSDVVAVANEGDEAIERSARFVFRVPRASEAASAVLAVVPLQLFAYHVAKLRGANVDRPRNLAKSVTVE
jgi:glucosamine--fructose-6-phosphate aminotransferase (isomerizing)